MPRKKKTPEEANRLLEETKNRIRLEQQARTQSRLEKIALEASEQLERELEQLALLERSDKEETSPLPPNLTNSENKEESSSSNQVLSLGRPKFLELETPD